MHCLASFLAGSHATSMPFTEGLCKLQENAQLKQLNAEAEERTRKANQRQQADVHKQVGECCVTADLVSCARSESRALAALLDSPGCHGWYWQPASCPGDLSGTQIVLKMLTLQA